MSGLQEQIKSVAVEAASEAISNGEFDHELEQIILDTVRKGRDIGLSRIGFILKMTVELVDHSKPPLAFQKAKAVAFVAYTQFTIQLRGIHMSRHDLRVVTNPSEERYWYALRVRPQAEYVVSHLLLKAGVEAFVPTETRFRRRTRYVAQKAEFAYPQIPGLVFAGFPGEPAWYWLLRNPLILGVEGTSRQAWRLDFHRLASFLARTQTGRLVMTGEEDGERLRMIKVGDRLVRSATNQVRVVSKKKRGEAVTEAEAVVQPTGAKARLLAQFALPQPVRMAA